MEPTGMEGFAKQAGALAGQAQGLRAAVDNGQLVMDPEAAERVAKVYEDKARDLLKYRARAQELTTTEAFGHCNIGNALERKFNDKVRPSSPEADSKAGLIPILLEMEDVMRNMAQAYRDSAKEVQGADEESARSLGRNL